MKFTYAYIDAEHALTRRILRSDGAIFELDHRQSPANSNGRLFERWREDGGPAATAAYVEPTPTPAAPKAKVKQVDDFDRRRRRAGE
jgi:hypothetical protein